MDHYTTRTNLISNVEQQLPENVELLDEECISIDLEKCVGEGNFGAVYLGAYKGCECAFKSTAGIEKYASEGVLYREVSLHPCICRYYGICRINEQIFIAMEYFEDGSLLDSLKKHKYSYSEKSHFCTELAKGLWHLHSLDVLHGDLALRNVLIDIVKKRVVLTDFGQSCRFPCTEPLDLFAPRWASPKLIRTRLLTKGSDIWALCCCFWEVFSDGKQPYPNLKTSSVMSRLQLDELQPSCDPAWPVSPILNHVFESRDNERWSARDLFQELKKLQK